MFLKYSLGFSDMKMEFITKLGKYKIKLIRMLKIHVAFLFVHFRSKQLIFVYKHTVCTERLATGDCSDSALTFKSI